jgi:hypothetical protein
MCLACEMDALWFAEMAAPAPASAGVPPAVETYPASLALGFLESAGETPAVPGGVPPALPGFRCEETGS